MLIFWVMYGDRYWDEGVDKVGREKEERSGEREELKRDSFWALGRVGLGPGLRRGSIPVRRRTSSFLLRSVTVFLWHPIISATSSILVVGSLVKIESIRSASAFLSRGAMALNSQIGRINIFILSYVRIDLECCSACRFLIGTG